MEFEGFSFLPSLSEKDEQNNDKSSQMNEERCNEQNQGYDNHYQIEEHQVFSVLNPNYREQGGQEDQYIQNQQNLNDHYQIHINYCDNYAEPIQNSQINQFDSYTQLQSSHELVPQNKLIQSSCSSNTLCQEQQINKRNLYNPQQLSYFPSNNQCDQNLSYNYSDNGCVNLSTNEEDEEELEQKQVLVQKPFNFKLPDMKYETSQLNYRENYYVIGDLYINVNMYLDGVKQNRKDKSSIWNSIRPVTHIQNNLGGFTSIIVDDTQAAMEDFDRVILLLNRQYCDHAVQQAKWLVQYKQYLINLDKTRKRIFDEYSHNLQLIKQKLTLNTLQSLQMAEEILATYYGGENDYIVYTYRRVNPENLSQTLYKGGMSKAMLKLIYITEENFRVDTLRNGMLELFNYEGYESVNYSYIFGNQDNKESQSHRKFTIFTIDDLEVEFEMEEIPYPLQKVSLSGGCWFTDQLRVYKFTISPQQLFQLSVTRKQLSSLNNECLYKNSEYYQSSENFINKFYGDNKKKRKANTNKKPKF